MFCFENVLSQQSKYFYGLTSAFSGSNLVEINQQPNLMKKLNYFLAGAFLFAQSVFNAQCTFYPAPPNGLVASYYFNNNVIETISNISAGNTNNGVAYTTDRFGNSNSALDFGNTGSTTALTKQYVSLNNPGIFSGDFTIVYWFKTPSSQNNRRMYLFSIDSTGLSDDLNMELNDASAFWVYWNSQGLPGFWGESVNQYQDNAWHMAVLRRESSNLDFYIDMNLKATYNAGTGTIGTNVNTERGKMNLGFDNATAYYISNYFEPLGFNGQMDDLSLYNIAVNTNVLENYYNNYDLAAWFTFSGNLDDNSGCENTALFATTTSSGADLPSLTTNRFSTGNSAYHFNGNGIIKVDAFTNNPILSCSNFFSNDFSVSFWFKTNANNKRMYGLSVDRSTSFPPYDNLAIEFNDSDYPSPGFWTYWNGQGNPGITEGAMNKYSDNVWHFLAYTRNAGTGLITAYIDTINVGTYIDSSPTIGSNTDTMDIGHYQAPWSLSNPNYNNLGFVGDLDEYKFFRHTLSFTEIRDAFLDPNTAYKSVGIHPTALHNLPVSIYPNPSSGLLQISSPVLIHRVGISDLTGRQLRSFIAGDRIVQADISPLAKGIYLVTLYDTNNTVISTQKIIKE
jgi:hypothetical protein